MWGKQSGQSASPAKGKCRICKIAPCAKWLDVVYYVVSSKEWPCETQTNDNKKETKKMTNIRKQTFEVTIETKLRDGCGNAVAPLTSGDIRKALLSALPYAESVTVK